MMHLVKSAMAPSMLPPADLTQVDNGFKYCFTSLLCLLCIISQTVIHSYHYQDLAEDELASLQQQSKPP